MARAARSVYIRREVAPPSMKNLDALRPMPSSLGILRLSGLLALLLLLGCPPRVPPQTAPARVLEWALGPQNLASPTSPDVFLVLVPKGNLAPKPAPALPPTKLFQGGEPGSAPLRLSACLRATSVLPAPQNDGRIFLAVGGAVHVLHPPDETTTLLAGADPDVHVSHLLAFRKVADGLEILASVKLENKSELEIHSLVVNANGILRAGLADLRFESPSAFFATYTVPHCTPDGESCLEISRDDEATFLESWSATGGAGFSPVTLAEAEGAQDAVWTPKNDGSIYVLERCP